MGKPENTSFNWLDHVQFPVINEKGQQLPPEVIEEYMRGVDSIEKFQEAFRRLLQHVILAKVSQRTLKATMKDIQDALKNKPKQD